MTAKTTISVRIRRSAPSRNRRKRMASIASGSRTTFCIAILVSRHGEFGNAGPCWRCYQHHLNWLQDGIYINSLRQLCWFIPVRGEIAVSVRTEKTRKDPSGRDRMHSQGLITGSSLEEHLRRDSQGIGNHRTSLIRSASLR